MAEHRTNHASYCPLSNDVFMTYVKSGSPANLSSDSSSFIRIAHQIGHPAPRVTRKDCTGGFNPMM